MNCEQVEELLSAYLDNALAPEERRTVAIHLHECTRCSSILADFRRFDALLSQLPRVTPAPELREKIFSSPEYLELTGTFDAHPATQEVEDGDNWTLPHPAAKHTWRNIPGRPRLVALPGGRSGKNLRSTSSAKPTLGRVPLVRQSHGNGKLRIAIGALVAAVLITLALGSIVTLNLLSKSAPITNHKTTTPPLQDQQQQQLPLSAGKRFVFLRGGALWSTLADANAKPERLTSTNVTVGPNWVVSPPLPGRSAGDMVAYIDLQSATVHTIRSDGLQDTVIQQPLLKHGVSPASVWDTQTGMAILNSLTWSSDGSMLAFIADPTNTELTNLYIYSKETGTVQMVPLPTKGSVSNPVWSPDGVRLAFELAHNGTISILDYNTQNRGLLSIADSIASQGSPGDSILTLDWSADVNMPAITWSVGTIGHVHSIWVRRVGVAGTVASLLMSGDYVQAIYSRNGHAGEGSWLLVSSIIGRPGDLWRVDAIPGARLVPLTNGRQIGFAWWSPDGTQVDYLDAISAGVGTFHVINLATGIDTLIANGVADTPAPAWSMDSQQLVYSTGTEIMVVNPTNLQTIQKPLILKLHGPASAYIWSATTNSSHQLVVAQNDVQQGIYLVNTQQNTFAQLDNSGANGPIEWTEIP